MILIIVIAQNIQAQEIEFYGDEPEVSIYNPYYGERYTSDQIIYFDAYAYDMTYEYRLKAFLKISGQLVYSCAGGWGEDDLPWDCGFPIDSSKNGTYDLYVLACTEYVCDTMNSPYDFVQVVVDIEAPVPEVSIHSPDNNENYTYPQGIELEASATNMTDDYRLKAFIKKTGQVIDESCYGYWGENSLPWCDFEIDDSMNGTYDLYVLACTWDVCDINYSPYDHIQFNVNIYKPKPSVTITKPYDITVYHEKQNIRFEAFASDMSPDYRLKAFLKQNDELIYDACIGQWGVPSFPYNSNCEFEINASKNGTYDLYVLACDSENCDINSSPYDHVQFFVNINPPSVTITNPEGNVTFIENQTLRFNAQASNMSSEYRLKTFLKQSGVTIHDKCIGSWGADSLPYDLNCEFEINESKSGDYDLYVLACDSENCNVNSSPYDHVQFSVNINQPIVSILNPDDEDIFTEKQNIRFQAEALNMTSKYRLKAFLKQSDILIHDSCMGSWGDNSLPYNYNCEFEIDESKNGNYDLYVVACNSESCNPHTSIYDHIQFQVDIDSTPTVNITNPVDDDIFTQNQMITFEAHADQINSNYRLKTFLKKIVDGNEKLVSDACIGGWGEDYLPHNNDCNLTIEDPKQNGTYLLYVQACSTETCKNLQSPYDVVRFEVKLPYTYPEISCSIESMQAIENQEVQVVFNINTNDVVENIQWDFDGNNTIDRETLPSENIVSQNFPSQSTFTTIIKAISFNGEIIQKSLQVDTHTGIAEITVRIIDENTYDPIINATVKLNEHIIPYVSGISAYQLQDIIPGEYSLEINCMNYDHYENTIFLTKGHQNETIYLSKNENSDYPRISNVDIYVPKGTYLFNKKIVKNPVFLAEISVDTVFYPRVDWGTKTPYQVNVYFHDSNIFKTFHWDNIKESGIPVNPEELIPGDKLCFEAVDIKGNNSNRHCPEMNVVEIPGCFLKSDILWKDGKYVLTDGYINPFQNLQSFRIPPQIPFFNQKEMEMKMPIMIKGEILLNGTGRLQLGYTTSIGGSAMGDKYMTFAGKRVPVFEATTGRRAYLAQRGGFKISPYLNIGMTNSSKNWNYSGGFGMGMNGEWKSPPFYYASTPPLYIRFGLGLTTDMYLDILNIQKSYHSSLAVSPSFNGALLLSPYGLITGGIGAADLISAEITGKLTMDWGIKFSGLDVSNDKMDLKLDLLAKGRIFIYEKQVALLNCTYNFLTGQSDCGHSTIASQLDLSTDGFHLMDRDYLNADYETVANTKSHIKKLSDATPATEKIILSNVFPESDLILIESPAQEKMKMLFISDDPNRTSSNRNILKVLDMDTTNAITTPIPIDDNGTADFHPSAIQLPDGRILAIWNDLKKIMDDNATLDDFLPNLEIASAIYLPDKNEWQSLGRLTNNEYLDRIPIITSSSDGRIMAVWIANKHNVYEANSIKPDSIHISCFQDKKWSVPVEIIETNGAIIRVTSSYFNDQAIIVWEEDMDQNMSTLTDRELYMCINKNDRWKSAQRLTNNNQSDTFPLLELTEKGNLLLVWGREDDILCVENLNFNATTTILQDIGTQGLDNIRLITRYSKGATLVWSDISLNNGVDIFACYYDDDEKLWSKAKQLTNDRDWEKNIWGVYQENGTLYMAYNKVRLKEDDEFGYIPDHFDLAILTYNENGDIAAKDIYLNNPEPGQGETVILYGMVENKGEYIEKNPTVEFIMGNQLINSQNIQTELAPGDIVEVTTICAMPNESDVELRFIVNSNDSANDRDLSNNGISMYTMRPNLSIEQFEYHNIPDHQIMLQSTILNNGAVDSANFKLVLANVHDHKEHQVLIEQIDSLKTGERYEFQWQVPEGDYVLYVDYDNTVVEYNENDNVFRTEMVLFNSLTFLPPNISHDLKGEFTIYVPLTIGEITTFSWDMNSDGIQDVETVDNHLDYQFTGQGVYNVSVVIQRENQDNITLGPFPINVDENKCSPDTTGDWIISKTCTLKESHVAQGNVSIQNNACLMIQPNVTLDIDLKQFHLNIEKGSGILIKKGATLQ